MSFSYLSGNNLSLQAVFTWAKSLVRELEKQDAKMVSVPVGGAIFWHAAPAPAGWLTEDGASYSKNVYPALFAEIGYEFGGSGDNFNVHNSGGHTIVRAK